MLPSQQTRCKQRTHTPCFRALTQWYAPPCGSMFGLRPTLYHLRLLVLLLAVHESEARRVTGRRRHIAWRPTNASGGGLAGSRRQLANCSVLLFHHVEKTGGTSLRAVLQRFAQLGELDLISFVNRQNRLQLQMILHKLHRLSATPRSLQGVRLAIEVHVGGALRQPYFLHSTLRDLLLLRSVLRAAGCRCNLVSLVRAPVLQALSWYSHFVGGGRVPLCFWQQASDCGTRIALGLTCHDASSVSPLTRHHKAAASAMWRHFDLVALLTHPEPRPGRSP